MKGYKVFNSDWTCRGFQYKVGEIYKHEGKISICKTGFHFCKKLIDCFNYYTFNPKNKVAIVEATGEVIEESSYSSSKCVTDEIKIVKELNWHEVLDTINLGEGNTGAKNTGDCNSGNSNTGNYNTGNYNIGDCNLSDKNIGCFCTNDNKCETIKLFNKESDWTLDTWKNSHAFKIIDNYFKLTLWVNEYNMTDKEKEKHPSYEATGGYLKELSYKKAWRNMWNHINDKEKEVFTLLPNFDKDIFKEITGIDIEEN